MVLKQILAEFGKHLPFSQLIVKFHVPIQTGHDFAKLYNLFLRLETVGLRPFRNEIDSNAMVRSNNKSQIESEYSFININKLC